MASWWIRFINTSYEKLCNLNCLYKKAFPSVARKRADKLFGKSRKYSEMEDFGTSLLNFSQMKENPKQKFSFLPYYLINDNIRRQIVPCIHISSKA